MSAGRRIYLYSAALVGLLATLASLLVLSDRVILLWAAGASPSRIAEAVVSRGIIGWLGLAGIAIWSLHWWAASRGSLAARAGLSPAEAESGPAARKAYLYIGQFVAAAVCLVEAGLAVSHLLRRILGESAAGLPSWPGWVLARAAGLLLALLLWGYLRRVAVRDGDFGHERGRAANWRRAYFYLMALTGFASVIAGAVAYLRAMIGLAGAALLKLAGSRAAPIPTGAAWHEPIVWSVTALVVGIPLAVSAWSTASRLAAGAPEVEHRALSRVSLLHAGLIFGTLTTLGSVAYLLQRGFLGLMGGQAGVLAAVWPGVVTAVACVPVGAISWLAFAASARKTASIAGEHTRAAALRRAVFYLLAGLALAVTWWGLTELLGLILLTVAGAAPTAMPPGADLRGRFSLGAALVLVGAPTWWGYWWPRQARARQNGLAAGELPEAGGNGAEERGSAARRLYLYAVIVSAAAVCFLAAAAIVLRLVGGRTPAALAGGPLARLVAAGIVALVWLVSHLIVLRGDRRQEVWVPVEEVQPPAVQAMSAPEGSAVVTGEAPPDVRTFRREALPALTALPRPLPEAPPRPVVVIDGGDGQVGVAALSALRAAFPDAMLWPLGLNPGAQAAMSAALGEGAPAAPPPDALARAAVILGPGDILFAGGLGGEVSPELVAALAASPAPLLLLPPRAQRLRWVAAPDWPLERWIENAVIEVGNVL